jgi:hypothetical protein
MLAGFNAECSHVEIWLHKREHDQMVIPQENSGPVSSDSF